MTYKPQSELTTRAAEMFARMLDHHQAARGRTDLRTYAQAYMASRPTHHIDPPAFDLMSAAVGEMASPHLPSGMREWQVANQKGGN
ncbi:hypothetical protein N9571_06785 [Yoonia sp.]|nr:hypothetical protein [Yoonia sp.]